MVLPQIGSVIQFENLTVTPESQDKLSGKVLAVSSSKITLLLDDEKITVPTTEEWFTFYDADDNIVCGVLATEKEIQKAGAS